ncbi:hypothetical protein HID58_044427 [Brassica napus]|uniref:Uncharacterized protein n=1 Tax=Brassica napus TaxID=3708 RepID=A0ABQ8BJB3_BRANA|nr:hypothetical protein HID58_044427 [Brassica napus]
MARDKRHQIKLSTQTLLDYQSNHTINRIARGKFIGFRSGAPLEEEEADKRAQVNAADDEDVDLNNTAGSESTSYGQAQPLPIRLHDTKDAAETASERKTTEPSKESSSMKAGDAITGVVLKTSGVDIDSSKESQSNSERHAMVDVSHDLRNIDPLSGRRREQRRRQRRFTIFSGEGKIRSDSDLLQLKVETKDRRLLKLPEKLLSSLVLQKGHILMRHSTRFTEIPVEIQQHHTIRRRRLRKKARTHDGLGWLPEQGATGHQRKKM